MSDKLECLTEEEEFALLNTTNEDRWNAVCDEIKRTRNGQYPRDWWQRVMLSGLFDAVTRKWKTYD